MLRLKAINLSESGWNITNQIMGPKVFPSPQVKNVIEKAIDSGEVDEDLADPWRKRKQLKLDLEDFESKAKKALAGDGDAAMTVAIVLFGLGMNEAGEWLKIASDTGIPLGMGMYGLHLSQSSCAIKRAQGIALLSEAAEGGNAWSCLVLGREYAEGVLVPRNDAHAERLLHKGLDTIPSDESTLQWLETEELNIECEGLLQTVRDRLAAQSANEE